MNDNRCVCCGDIIPEGMMACPNCLVVSKKTKKVNPWKEINDAFSALCDTKGGREDGRNEV